MIAPARTAVLERERQEWRNKADQVEKSLRTSQVISGPTVDEEYPTLEEDFDFGEFDEEVTQELSLEDFTEEEMLESKLTHIRDAVDGNNSYDIEPSSHTREDDLVLDTTWAVAMRDGKLKNRLCARDFNNTKRDDLFAPGSQSIASRLVDFRKSRYPGMVSYTIDIAAAHNTIDEPDNVVVIPPPEWIKRDGRREKRLM